ncbi:cation transporter [Billgrantia azerbaijanica]|nr:cation transporter [Halomonas azerbaijanica]
MMTHDLGLWQHRHDFTTRAERRAERRTLWVVGLTSVTMLLELWAGWLTGSMALLADGWHMAGHTAALGLAVLAYRVARHYAGSERFTFGTGKIAPLAGYTNALLLGAGALWMAWESLQRLMQPVAIHFGEAMLVALLGLTVNLASAWLLRDDHHHEHGHGHGDGHGHTDHNLKAAYLHVLADALTSLLAIAALGGGMFLGWSFLDPLMGLVGAVVVGYWAWGLAVSSSRVLLDAEDHSEVVDEVRRLIGAQPDHEVADLHVWRVGQASRACILSVVTHYPRPTAHYHRLLAEVPGIDHLTVEVNHCRDCEE